MTEAFELGGGNLFTKGIFSGHVMRWCFHKVEIIYGYGEKIIRYCARIRGLARDVLAAGVPFFSPPASSFCFFFCFFLSWFSNQDRTLSYPKENEKASPITIEKNKNKNRSAKHSTTTLNPQMSISIHQRVLAHRRPNPRSKTTNS